MDINKIKLNIIEAGEIAVNQLIAVAKEEIVKVKKSTDDGELTEREESLSADKLKNAAATKKLAIFDAFEILARIEEEKVALEGGVIEKETKKTGGFAERNSK